LALLVEDVKMRIARIAFVLALISTVSVLALISLGFWARTGAPELDVRTFNLEHRSGYEAAELVDPYIYGDREGAPGAMSVLPNALSIRETPDNLDKIARVLSEFDQPVPPVRLRFQLIEADSFQDPDPAIAEVVNELRSLFRFEGYRLLGEALVTLATGSEYEQSFSQRFLGTDELFTVEAAAQLFGPGAVRLSPVKLWRDSYDGLLETSVTVADGQTVVIGGGKALEGGRSFILTVKAES
jgi:hypothetical protein